MSSTSFPAHRQSDNEMRIACIIQARMGSKRLPGKVQMDIGGRPMIWHVVQRAKASGMGLVQVAWPSGNEDENDVLGRYHRIATELAAEAVVRITGDCPLMAPEAISDVLSLFLTLSVQRPYVANDIVPTYPNGIGVECFPYCLLEYAHLNAYKPADREHVTPFIKRDKRIAHHNVRCPINGLSDLKLSVDTQEDLDFVRAIDAAGPHNLSLAATVEAIGRVKDQNHA